MLFSLLRYTSSTHTAIILSLEAVFGSMLGIILLGESLTVKFIIECAAIFISVLASETRFAFLRPRKKKILA
ncbi:MAG: EamA family transporter [Bacillota bacterium]